MKQSLEAEFWNVGQGHFRAVDDFGFAIADFSVSILVNPEGTKGDGLEANFGEWFIFGVGDWEIGWLEDVEGIFVYSDSIIRRGWLIIHRSDINGHGGPSSTVGSTIVYFEVEAGRCITKCIRRSDVFQQWNLDRKNLGIICHFSFRSIDDVVVIQIKPECTHIDRLDTDLGNRFIFRIVIREVRNLEGKECIFDGGDSRILGSCEVIHRRYGDRHHVVVLTESSAITDCELEGRIVGAVGIRIGNEFEKTNVDNIDQLIGGNNSFAVIDGVVIIHIVPECTSRGWLKTNLGESLVLVRDIVECEIRFLEDKERILDGEYRLVFTGWEIIDCGDIDPNVVGYITEVRPIMYLEIEERRGDTVLVFR